MIYDCFSFFNELDVLEIRLNTLNEVVDKFVLVEAPWTHTGKPKPLYFEENKKRFAPFLDKIIHVVISDADLPPFPPNATERDKAWIRENTQRNAISEGLADARPDDIIIISDLDEIPDPKAITSLTFSASDIVRFNLKNFCFYLNNLDISSPIWKLGPKALTFSRFSNPDTYHGFKYSPAVQSRANPGASATKIRFAKPSRILENAGWHFSYMGSIDKIALKMNAIAESEPDKTTDTSRLRQLINNHINIFGATGRNKTEAMPLSLGFPEYVIINYKKLSNQILPADIQQWNRNKASRIIARLNLSIHTSVIALLIKLTPASLHPLCAKIRKFIRF